MGLVDLFEHRGAGAEFIFIQVPERGFRGVHGLMNFPGIGIDKHNAGKHLVFGLVILHASQR